MAKLRLQATGLGLQSFLALFSVTREELSRASIKGPIKVLASSLKCGKVLSMPQSSVELQ